MKTYEKFTQEVIDEALLPAAAGLAGKKILDALGSGVGDIVSAPLKFAKKVAKKTWEGGDREIRGVKGQDHDKPLNKSN